MEGAGDARRLDGKRLAATLNEALRERVARLGWRPRLSVIRVGEDPESARYVRTKRRACERVGIESEEHTLGEGASFEETAALIERLNGDEAVDGILLQLPLPGGLDERALLAQLDPARDVDGLHPANLGRTLAGEPGLRPCTPLGILTLLRHEGVALAGMGAVVIGRSRLVGRPMAAMLTSEDCTVTLCHSQTRGLAEVVRRADLVVSAVGEASLIQGAWLKPGAVVVDVGMSRDAQGKWGGDVDASAWSVASALTPVPGGVGPMTVATLLAQTVAAGEARRSA